MGWLALVAAALIIVVFIDTFETMILPRRVRHSIRLTRFYFQVVWFAWRTAAGLFPPGRWRNSVLSIFGPLSLLGLVLVWAVTLMFGFALLLWGLGTPLKFEDRRDESFGACLYFSSTTFFTLGYGDVVPTAALGRTLGVIEAGIGFGFLAMVISYLPVLYQAFSRRETLISMLDARAGSPPTAAEFLRRLSHARSPAEVNVMLAEWERWAAELLESHLSFPVLSYYRSQHDNQSWVAALAMILDVSAVLIAAAQALDGYQVRLTFAMARHAAVDLGLVFNKPPVPLAIDRLPAADLEKLLQSLRSAGLPLRDDVAAISALAELRGLYEPFVNALALHLFFDVPAFQPAKPPVDNWQTSPWMPRSPDLGALAGTQTPEHYH